MRNKEDTLLDNLPPNFLDDIIETLLHNLLANGELSKDDLEDKDRIFEKFSEIIEQERDFQFIIDHRDSILKSANNFLKNKKYDFAIIFFAMYFEHSINNILSWRLSQRNVTKKSTNELIKSININGKFTWLLEILELPKFNKKYLKTINLASTERNSLIHYKWNPVDESKDRVKELFLLIEEIKKSVTYMKKYESRLLYKNSKGKIKKFMKRTSKNK